MLLALKHPRRTMDHLSPIRNGTREETNTLHDYDATLDDLAEKLSNRLIDSSRELHDLRMMVEQQHDPLSGRLNSDDELLKLAAEWEKRLEEVAAEVRQDSAQLYMIEMERQRFERRYAVIEEKLQNLHGGFWARLLGPVLLPLVILILSFFT
ncbi:hypothetical protein PRK78_002690 [Emydomyces testavorans]|uniref:Uncharacterized protein n=1 Tax=Emydomyces testavorans TaxID=2070801 RepID=A0AAF0DFH2_9EURO|nr:hypothetical protein PRK78_002690 [Emydomyces testavorans]